ncbi:MAG: family 10 glycosylhydrolase, partial [Chitinophagaceae bacterium]|nr:family 10 glycosylhydrolase [Chitinophagaceae bacterium]
MKRLLLLATYACCGILQIKAVQAQHSRTKQQLSDSALFALEAKYLHTPLTKTTRPNGDVFLQRNMDEYLGATVFKNRSAVPPDHDFGDDHNSQQLAAFLNRPHPSTATLTKYFNDAATEFSVPANLLMAVAQVQSNWTQVSESLYGSWGIMGIIENPFTTQISQAATLLNAPADDIKNDAQTNIRAAAALLRQYYGSNTSANPADWFEAIRLLTGLTDESMKTGLALRIYDVLKKGNKSISLWGEIIDLPATGVSLPKSITEPDRPILAARTTVVDYPNAVANFTTCNYDNRPAGGLIKYYFIHYIATGTYQGAISWFKNCTSQVSAHYVIRNNDGEVTQVVQENQRAWTQGVTSYNDMGIGVEHEVLASNLAMWDSDPMLTAAANLCINVCNRRGIPKIRRVSNGDAGIYGHSDVKATDCPNLTAARWTNFLNRLNTVSVAPPTLYSITNPGSATQVVATWKANIEPTLIGYRLYYATNDALTAWALAANETTLTAATTSITLNASQFIVPPAGDVYHFKLTAVVSNGTNPVVESSGSDIYSRSSNTSGPTVLIVDGFDRTAGSYTQSSHPFSTSYFKGLRNKANLQISSVANEKVEDGTFLLTNYNIVVWFVGDESSANVVLSTAEKNAIKAFLDGGGKLLITGSEMAYNIGRSAAAAYDLPFMNGYLKSSYVGDGASTYTPASGVVGSPFAGLTIPFGIVYPEDFPDAISPFGGAISIMSYNIAPNLAGVAYTGTFGTGSTPGAIVYLSYTLETAADSSIVKTIGKTLEYFGLTTFTIATANDDAATAQSGYGKRINVLANDYGNGVPINPASLVFVTQPVSGTVTKDNSGNVTYVSGAAFTGSDSYQYKVQNTNGQFSNVATVNLTVVAATVCNP